MESRALIAQPPAEPRGEDVPTPVRWGRGLWVLEPVLESVLALELGLELGPAPHLPAASLPPPRNGSRLMLRLPSACFAKRAASTKRCTWLATKDATAGF